MDKKKIISLVDKYFDEMVAIRRHLHRYPELSYREFNTTEFICKKLSELDIKVDQPLETGCVGVLKGEKTSDRVIAFRADIDALPIQEEGDHKQEFLSKHQGIAHCCGHDSHTANLLGVANILAEMREDLEGTVLLIFQPGEEKLPGGGRLLCETGYLQEKEVDVIYGLHTFPRLAPGKIAVKKGPLMARPDEFRIEVKGKGGHAASPHEAIDPVVIASEIVTQLQTIVSRKIKPTEPAVVTVGKISGGSAHNVIPESVELLGTVRTFAQETADLIKQQIEAITKGVTDAAGGDYDFTFDYGYPAVTNTGWATDILTTTAQHMIGSDIIDVLEEPIMAGEDFAFYQQQFPGVFFFLGTGSRKANSTYSWHHPRYNIDEEALKTGAALMAALAFQPLPKTAGGKK